MPQPPTPTHHPSLYPTSPPLFSIPEELWLHIFTLSTSSPRSHENRGSSYIPFAAVPLKDEDWSYEVQRRLRTKRRLMLVCKAWKAIAVEVVYREIRFGYGTGSLIKAVSPSSLESSNDGTDVTDELQEGKSPRDLGYGPFVRHLEISPLLLDSDPFNPIAIANVLAHCTNITSLSRTYIIDSGNPPLRQIRFDPSPHNNIASFPLLQSLTRIDWWLSGGSSSRYSNKPSDNIRNCFTDLLGDILYHTPYLQYLTIGSGTGDYSFNLNSFPPTTTKKISSIENPIVLPQIKILRLELEARTSYIGFLAAQTWKIPKLETLILGNNYSSCFTGTITTTTTTTNNGGILKQCGTSIKTIEIVWDKQRETEKNAGSTLQAICEHCPNLEELNFCHDQWWSIAGEQQVQLQGPGAFGNLHTVRLGLGETVIERNCTAFLKDRRTLPGLKKVFVHGRERSDRQKTRVDELKIALQARDVVVEDIFWRVEGMME